MQPTMRAPSRSPPSYSKGSECGAALCALSKPDTFVQPTGRPTPMEHEMTNDDDYVYDEESGEWMSASELAARKAAAGQEIGRAPSELQSLMRISYAVFCLKKKKSQIQKQEYAKHTKT